MFTHELNFCIINNFNIENLIRFRINVNKSMVYQNPLVIFHNIKKGV